MLYLMHPSAVAALCPTTSGWRCRSSGGFDHDYLSHETWRDLEEWLGPHATLTRDRERCAAHLSALLASSPDRVRLQGPPTWPPDEAADRVLRHLERGW